MDDDHYAEKYPELDFEERTYVAFHDCMMDLYGKGDKKCMDIATKLIIKSECPPLILARCYMVLSTQRHPFAVQYAETAVEILNTEIRDLVVPEAFPTAQFELAQYLLRKAQARAAKRAQAETPELPTISKDDEQAIKIWGTTLPLAQQGQHFRLTTPATSRSSTLQDQLLPHQQPRSAGLATPGPSRGVSLQEQLLPHQQARSAGLATPGPSRGHSLQDPPASRQDTADAHDDDDDDDDDVMKE